MARAELLDLPPYSPDLNPIEKAWPKLKQLLRSTRARAKEALDKATPELLPEIPQQTPSHGSDSDYVHHIKCENALGACLT